MHGGFEEERELAAITDVVEAYETLRRPNGKLMGARVRTVRRSTPKRERRQSAPLLCPQAYGPGYFKGT